MSEIIKNKTRAKSILNQKPHGLSHTKLYRVWKDIIHRCNNKNHKAFINYGGRGVEVCERWLNVSLFVEDMGNSFQDGLSIDRIDNNKGYFKDNCRWVTSSIQQRNKRVLQRNNTSGFKGVRFNKKSNRWTAAITKDKVLIHLGCFDTAIDAAGAYDKYVIDNNLEHSINVNLTTKQISLFQ